jgi:hypothetical protein
MENGRQAVVNVNAHFDESKGVLSHQTMEFADQPFSEKYTYMLV